ncbi:MAG: hypothetical protein QF805_13170, partial [Pirellulaceae bacterium]|nr:hypothetical protein [Pirellulaceae bacterium]
MAKLVALEWDTREVRVAIGSTRGRNISVEETYAVPLSAAVDGDGDGDGDGEAADEAPDFDAQLQSAISKIGAGRADALIALNRSSVELRQFKVPVCPDAELPDLVRFQATRQFSNVGENCPIDFVTLNREEDGIQVLAAALAPQLLAEIRSWCGAAELQVKHVVLRSFATASLMQRGGNKASCQLVVDMLSDEVDLTVLVDGRASFARTVRRPATNDLKAQATALLGEVRRTIPAAQNQLGGQRVEQITLCGDDSDMGHLKEALEESLELPVNYFDPFGVVEAANRPENPGRYSALLGLLVDAAAEQRHGLDFLNPTQAPKPKSNKRPVLLGLAVVAAIVAAGSFALWSTFDTRKKELASVQEEFRLHTKRAERAKQDAADLKEIEEFIKADVHWLDELRNFSKKLPSADDAMVTSLVLAPELDGGGHMVVQGLVSDAPKIGELERNLTDDKHEIVPQVADQDDLQFGKYRWRVTTTVNVKAPAEE